jgi:hypothetical protein
LKTLWKVIRENGSIRHDVKTNKNYIEIKFGKLFHIYANISNKLVGILLRARKYNYVQFDGEILYQGRDEDCIIRLINN